MEEQILRCRRKFLMKLKKKKFLNGWIQKKKQRTTHWMIEWPTIAVYMLNLLQPFAFQVLKLTGKLWILCVRLCVCSGTGGAPQQIRFRVKQLWLRQASSRCHFFFLYHVRLCDAAACVNCVCAVHACVSYAIECLANAGWFFLILDSDW